MTLHTKYRPATFEAVVGNRQTVESVKAHLASGTQRAFLFHGEPGTGKTTMARLIVQAVGAIEIDCLEVNAGADTGVDAARSLLDWHTYRGMGPNGTKVIIVDECHMLTKNAWNCLLKSVEEPPEWLYWCFCTTEFGKVPKAVVQRCAGYRMELLHESVVTAKLINIAFDEDMVLGLGVAPFIAQEAGGSLRRAIVTLGKVAAVCGDLESVKRMLVGVADENTIGVIDFCRALSHCTGFKDLQPHLRGFAGRGEAEGIRRVVVSYYSKVAIGARDAATFRKAAAILEEFGTPYVAGADVEALVVSSWRFLKVPRGT